MTIETATAGAANAGTPDQATAAAANQGTTAAAAPAWATGLETGDLEYIGSKGYKELAPLISDARHADKLKGELGDLKSKALTVPGADAKAEDWAAFYGKLGRPEKPEAYDFKLPEGLPENFPYDGESAAKFKSWAHSKGLTPAQAQGLHDDFIKQQAEGFAAQVAAIATRGEQAHGELVKAWGEKGSPGYTENVQFADRFIKNQGGDDLLAEMKSNGLLSPEGIVLSPKLAQAMAAAGRALYREGGGALATGNNTPGGVNPFDPKTPNITAQMQVFRANPELAKAYIRAAGKQPSDFGLT